MTQNFEAIKKKYARQAWIAAAVLGVLCGVTVACALLLAFKLSAIELAWYFYLLIGLGVAALCVYPWFLLLRPDDKKLAKKLDSEFGLKQKVQTMVEFSGETGAMAVLQREQTDGALTEAAAKRPSVRGLLKFLFIPVVALAIALAGALVPAKKTTVYIPPFKLSAVQEAALSNLINDVNSSELGEGLKVVTAGALSDLLTKLKTVDTQSEMRRRVTATVKIVDAAIAGSDSFVPVYNALSGNNFTKPFAVAMLNGTVSYKYTSADEVKTLEIVGRKSEACSEAIVEKLSGWVTGVRDTFFNKVAQEPSDGSTETQTQKVMMTLEEMKTRADGYGAAFTECLGQVEFAVEGDALCTAIAAFAQDIAVPLKDGVGAISYLDSIEKVCKDFVTPACEDALSVQSYNCLMDELIRNELARIFGMSVAEFGSNAAVAPYPVEEEDGDGEGGTPSGGGGDGENKYGSDDIVLDPDTGAFVSYGELLEEYDAKIQERIREFEALASKEDATPEEKAAAKYVQAELTRYVSQYIDRLYNDNPNK